MPGSVIDTNVLIYLVSADSTKAGQVEELLTGGAKISIQVLNETANVLRRKANLSWLETHAFLALVRSLTSVESLTIETHEEGLRISERYQLPLYDGMIVAAAILAGCDRLWSEDMQDGLLIDGTLRIENPFRI
jgi:predicted nucleic acid-binding protein